METPTVGGEQLLISRKKSDVFRIENGYKRLQKYDTFCHFGQFCPQEYIMRRRAAS